MGRIYAGILGPLALAVVVVRSLRHGGNAESTLMVAALCLLGFAAIGYVIGTLAQWTIDDSVRARVEMELAKGPDKGQRKAPPSAAPQPAGT